MKSFFSLFLLCDVGASYLLPNPTGPYNVTLTTGPLTDFSRNITTNGTTIPRALMLSIFQPTECKTTTAVQYMPNATAIYQGPYLQRQFNLTQDFSPLLLGAELPVCSPTTSRCAFKEDAPILLFSPGYAIPRLDYSVLASAIASKGFTVISIDHPGDSNAITYPDGSTIYYQGPSSPTEEQYNAYTDARVEDVTFLINQLSNQTAISHLLPHRNHAFSTKHIAMLGHSLGGVTAVIAAAKDHRVKGAIDWDGTIFYPLPNGELRKPVMYVSEANATDPTWVNVWPQLKGPKVWIEVANTTHQSFTDSLVLLQAAGQDAEGVKDFLGAIEPGRLVSVMVAYTVAWMRDVFRAEFDNALLTGKDGGKFPEAEIKRRDNF